jgi:hypothetical protein
MDEKNQVLLPNDLRTVLLSPEKKVYETEICFYFLKFNSSLLVFNYRSYTINIVYTKEIREIKIDRGILYSGIYLDSIMSYNSWKNYNGNNINIDHRYDTFWFNLFPLLKQHMHLIIRETELMNPVIFHLSKADYIR